MRLPPILLATVMFTLTAAQAEAATFSAHEIEVIVGFYHGAAESDAPRGRGRGRNKGLPQGIAKNLARGKPLPPGIAMQQLPPTLIERLPPPPAGFERIVVAGKILLIETATQIVHDVLTDVLFR